MSAHRETHLLAAFVHGALVALHTLGAVYNLRKRANRFQVCAHVAGIAFSAHSVGHHIRKANAEYELGPSRPAIEDCRH